MNRPLLSGGLNYTQSVVIQSAIHVQSESKADREKEPRLFPFSACYMFVQYPIKDVLSRVKSLKWVTYIILMYHLVLNVKLKVGEHILTSILSSVVSVPKS